MKYRVDVGGQEFEIEIGNERDEIWSTLNGQPVLTDAQCVDENCLYSVLMDNRSHEVLVEENEGRFVVTVDGFVFDVGVQDERAARLAKLAAVTGSQHHDGEVPIKAPMPGFVRAVHVAPGDPVGKGKGLVVLEAMKMENDLVAPREAVVKEVLVQPGDKVEQGQLLLVIA